MAMIILWSVLEPVVMTEGYTCAQLLAPPGGQGLCPSPCSRSQAPGMETSSGLAHHSSNEECGPCIASRPLVCPDV